MKRGFIGLLMILSIVLVIFAVSVSAQSSTILTCKDTDGKNISKVGVTRGPEIGTGKKVVKKDYSKWKYISKYKQ